MDKNSKPEELYEKIKIKKYVNRKHNLYQSIFGGISVISFCIYSFTWIPKVDDLNTNKNIKIQEFYEGVNNEF